MVPGLKLADVAGTKRMLVALARDNGTCVNLQEKQHK
jgi:hypothetical protein